MPVILITRINCINMSIYSEYFFPLSDSSDYVTKTVNFNFIKSGIFHLPF